MKNFVLIGATGYIAPRHILAIKQTKNNLLACIDINLDSSKILETFDDAKCYNSFDEFKSFVEEKKDLIDYVVICSPNFLHYDHCSWALQLGLDVICEKPLTLNYNDLSKLEEYENLYGGKLWSILQLRLHDSIINLKQKSLNLDPKHNMAVDLTYITPRNKEYLDSWKGDALKSGGVLVNIGLHFFDMLIYIFGEIKSSEVHHKHPHVLSGVIIFESVSVRWFLSILEKHSPKSKNSNENLTYRSITFDGDELDFSAGFNDLHTLAYKDILNGNGFGIDQNRPVMSLLEEINNKEITKFARTTHPFMDIL